MRVFLVVAQVVCLCAVVAGAAVVYWPAALIVGGALGAVVIERQS